jgi:thiosulfate/3-mercaptopyruvate sulfurtransferase
MPNDPFIEADAISALGPVRYLDARDAAAFAAGHAPNAIRAPSNDWDTLAKTSGSGFENTAFWEATLNALGIDNAATAVVYDTGAMTNAARVWFILQYYGAKAVILNGGWPAIAAATALPDGVGPGHGFKAHPQAGTVGLVDRATLKTQLNGEADVFDTRTRAEYTGEDPRKNARGGHLPGARHLSHADLLDNGRVKPAAEVRAMLDRVGFQPGDHIVTHCEGGGRAAFGAAAAARAGFDDVRVYYLSFADWAKDDSCPIVRD